MLITPELIIEWGSWYHSISEEQVRTIFGKGLTELECLNLPLKPNDRLWIIARPEVMLVKDLRLFGCYCAEAVLPIYAQYDPDEKRLEAVLGLTRKYLDEKINIEEVKEANKVAEELSLTAPAPFHRVASAVSGASRFGDIKARHAVMYAHSCAAHAGDYNQSRSDQIGYLVNYFTEQPKRARKPATAKQLAG